MNISTRIKERFLLGLFLVLVSFAFTEYLDKLPLRLWDESRLAANAIEMYTDHNWLVTHYDGTVDLWNTKPPLLIWLQVISMHLFGVSVLSIRLVSAIAGILSTLVLYLFIKKNTGNTWSAFLAGIVLTSMEGFNGYHAARTADYDALLTLFSLLTIVQFYYYIRTSSGKNIILFFLFLTLGCLTKGISALLFVPGFFLYTLLEKKFLSILTDYRFYIGAFSFLLVTGLYYYTRELQSPGYLEAVYNNELGGRYLIVNEGHQGNAFFYIKVLGYTIHLWFCVLLFTLAFLPLYIDAVKTDKLVSYLSLLSFCFVVVLTSSQTKIAWYITPFYPLCAALILLLLFHLLNFSVAALELNTRSSHAIVWGVSCLLVAGAYYNIVMTNYHPDEKTDYEKRFYNASLFFQDHKYPVAQLKLVVTQDEFKQPLNFYVKQLALSNKKIAFGDYKKLKTGDHVFVASEAIDEYIKKNYATHELFQYENVHLYLIEQ